jgi:CelD/BcsL family acetyltransferase involved in cellulose biosynthesis
MLKALPAARDRALSEALTLNAQASASLTVITSLKALRDIEKAWRSLEADTQNHTSPFQSYDWAMAWAEIYVDGSDAPQLNVLAGYENGELVFLWPLMRVKQMGLAVMTWLTEPFGQYGDVLVRKGSNAKAWIKSSINLLRRLRDIDMVRLRHVRADSHLAVHAAQFLKDARLVEQAPYLDLAAFKTDEDYENRYTSTQRKRRKKIRKALETIGPISFTQLNAGTVADEAMQQAISEKNKWLADRGRINRVLGCPKHLAFLKNLSRRRNSSVTVVVTEMKTGTEPCSWEIGFRHKDVHHGYITSHTNSLTDLSPGRLHMDLSQREAIKGGMARFDLMVPNDAHKESWSSAKVETRDYFIPVSLSGRIAGATFLQMLRPALRHIYYRLDTSILRKINFRSVIARRKDDHRKDA